MCVCVNTSMFVYANVVNKRISTFCIHFCFLFVRMGAKVNSAWVYICGHLVVFAPLLWMPIKSCDPRTECSTICVPMATLNTQAQTHIHIHTNIQWYKILDIKKTFFSCNLEPFRLYTRELDLHI